MEEGFEEVWMGPLEEMIRPYERLIPVVVAIGTFMTLQTILSLLSWIPGLFLAIIFPILQITGVTKAVKETREVERLVL
jgi:ABC-type transport system involved in cytochrome bd biosynthesis fused ATPase/permease subunit